MMAAIRQRDETANRVGDPDEDSGVDMLTAEEGAVFFDQEARKLLGMSGDEFLRRWDAGEFKPVPDTKEGRPLGRLVMLIPFARPTPD